jgi:hypothetical protein
MDPFFSSIQEDGCFYYILPAGTSLFRGDTNFDHEKPLKQGPIFFAIDPVYAETYGITSEFRVMEEIKVVALDKSLEYFYNRENTNDKIKKILIKNYGYNPDNPNDINGKRSSDNKSDTALVKHLCESGYEGYGANNLTTDFGGVFNPEIVLCDSSKVTYVKRITTDDKIKSLRAENLLRKNRITRKKRNSPLSADSGPRQRLFGSPSSSNSSSGSKTPPRKSPRKTLFFNSGGKKSKKRNRHKK